MTTTLLERQVELRELLILPPSLSPPANKLESAAVGPLAGAAGPGSPRAAPSTMAGGRCGRWRGRSKRGRHDDVVVMTNNDGEHHLDKQNTAQPRRDYCKRRRKKQQSGTSMVVTSSAPDLFDGYQWRKYGQKLIEGAMYPRSYYRCTRSADQGCAAKRTVQRTDDGGGSTAAAAAAAPPKYTVVRMGEHTCTANDSPEAAPVILETTAAAGAFLRPHTASSAASCSTTPSPAAAGIGSSPAPAISDNALSTITAASSFVSDSFVDDYYGGLFAAVHDSDWVPALAASSPSAVPTIEDFAGRPIRSPVHVYAADGWTIDQLLLQQLVNEPTVCRI